MLEDDYTVDNLGKVDLVRKTDDNFDRLIKVDDNGNETNTSITLDKGILKETPTTVLDGRSKKIDDYTIMQTSDNKQAVKLFEFLGKNTQVEWGKISITGGSIISTSHEARRDRSSGTVLLSLMTQVMFMNSKNFIMRNGIIIDQVHSHPNSTTPGASGDYGNGGSKNGDKKFAERVEAINPNLPLKIYHIKTGGVYFQYNSRQNLIR